MNSASCTVFCVAVISSLVLFPQISSADSSDYNRYTKGFPANCEFKISDDLLIYCPGSSANQSAGRVIVTLKRDRDTTKENIRSYFNRLIAENRHLVSLSEQKLAVCENEGTKLTSLSNDVTMKENSITFMYMYYFGCRGSLYSGVANIRGGDSSNHRNRLDEYFTIILDAINHVQF